VGGARTGMDKYINQKTDKDCIQVSLCNLLGIEYNSIPEFYKEYEQTKDGNLFEDRVDEFLKSIGRCRITLPVQNNNGDLSVDFFISENNVRCLGILGKKERGYTHSVVLEIIKNERGAYRMKIEHDPKPNTDYDIGDLLFIELVVKL
jgi:hypothetical protein